MTLRPSGHVDTFARDNLPPEENWPDLLLDGFDYPDRLPFAVDLSRQTRSIIRQNMIVSLGIVAVLIPATIFGLGIGPAVAVHEGSTLIVVANALRLLAYKEKSGAKAIMETQA